MVTPKTYLSSKLSGTQIQIQCISVPAVSGRDFRRLAQLLLCPARGNVAATTCATTYLRRLHDALRIDTFGNSVGPT